MNSTAPAQLPLFSHPLEAIRWFRRYPPTPLRDIIYTLFICLINAVIFGLVALFDAPLSAWRQVLVTSAVISCCIGFSMHVLYVSLGTVVSHWFPNASPGRVTFLRFLAAMTAVGFGYWSGARLVGLQFRFWSGTVLFAIWVGATLAAIGATQRRFMQSQLELERERSARIEAERLMTVSRLQTLQAQIEPHFLFNTLANVSSLIEVEPKQARKMLDELTLLLRAALDSTRKTTTALRKELQVVEAYLGVLKVRMGERLKFCVEAAPELMALPVPAMLLQPIVENAVKHGIEPRVHGGSVYVRVQRDDAQLAFVVEDDGVGFAPNAKDNVGLGAVRERLAVQFGRAASLQTERTPEQRTRVTIRIPFPESSAPT